jgi:3'-phosphoadenosine 5'-phosphosulfate sulfotransferase (PAPS reductase)/FAD synthetase
MSTTPTNPETAPGAIVRDAFAYYAPSKAFVLLSGGKDSTVTLDWYWRNHPGQLTGALHINTGIGLRSTRDFAERFCRERGISFHEAHAPIAYEDLVRRGWRSFDGTRQRGFPGPAAHLFAYTWLKERALDAFTSLQKDHRLDNIALITGVRSAESARRMGTTDEIRKDGSKIWVAPLAGLSNADMADHRERYSVPMSPASSTLHFSAECLCGAFGDPQELDMIDTFHGDDEGRAVPRIRALQREMESAGVERCRWATDIRGDKRLAEPPGPLCAGCWKQSTLFAEEAAS